jgi:SH3 domain-containing YSC84-like protein 1
MTKRALLCGVGMLMLILVEGSNTFGQILGPPPSGQQIVIDANNVLIETMNSPGNSIPQSLLSDAQAVAIIPNTLNGAFIFGVQHGRGVLVMRDGTGTWQAPRMIQITGGSFGYQIGVQSSDLVLVFRTRQSVANLLAGTLKVGVGASAAAGPVGRQAAGATDLSLRAEILTYARSRGAFIGVSIDGAVISMDPTADAMYYQPPGVLPASGMQLLQTIAMYSAVVAPGGVAPTAAVGQVAAVQGSAEIEATRQQLDTASRQLASNLDDQWKHFLQLPPEVYVPNGMPNPQTIQQALAKYEDVAQRSEFTALQTRPEFQETLKWLRQMSRLQTPPSTTLNLPPPPTAPVVR